MGRIKGVGTASLKLPPLERRKKQQAPLDDQDLVMPEESRNDDNPLVDVVIPRKKGRTPMSVMGGRINHIHWSPFVYVALGVVLSAIWALGTSVQVLTSEAWMMGKTMREINFTAFGQLWEACSGHLTSEMWVPFVFGWGVQIALIVASIGIELPRDPEWRYWLAWISIIGLIGVNSCGDFASSAQYGFWGQLGFTIVIFFVTFCVGLFAIMAFMHTWKAMKQR